MPKQTWLDLFTETVSSVVGYLTAPSEEAPFDTEPKLGNVELPHDTRIIRLVAKLSPLFPKQNEPPENRLIRLNGNNKKLFQFEEETIFRLSETIRAGNVDELQQVVNQSHAEGVSPVRILTLAMTLAVVYEQSEMVGKLLDQLKNQTKEVHQTVFEKLRLSTGFTILHLCVLSNTSAAVLQQILQVGVVSSLVNDGGNKYGMSPIMLACLLKSDWAYDALISAGAVLGKKDAWGNTTLILAAAYPDHHLLPERPSGPSFVPKVFSHLSTGDEAAKKAQAIVNEANNDGITAVHLAASLGDLVTVQQLVTNGAKLAKQSEKTTTEETWSPLHFASENGNEQLVDYLLSSGADASAASAKCNVTALHTASFYGRAGVAKLLLNAGAEVTAETTQQGTSLLFACDRGSLSCVQHLLRYLVQDYKSRLSAESQDAKVRGGKSLQQLRQALYTTACKAIEKERAFCFQAIVVQGRELILDWSPLLQYAVKENCTNETILETLTSVVTSVHTMEVEGKNILKYCAEKRNTVLFKHLLTSNRLFSQVVLQDSAVTSFTRHLESIANPQGEPSVQQCVACMSKPSNTKLFPCNHTQYCKLCAQMALRADPRCPMCRVHIDSIENT